MSKFTKKILLLCLATQLTTAPLLQAKKEGKKDSSYSTLAKDLTLNTLGTVIGGLLAISSFMPGKIANLTFPDNCEKYINEEKEKKETGFSDTTRGIFGMALWIFRPASLPLGIIMAIKYGTETKNIISKLHNKYTQEKYVQKKK